MDKTKKTPKPVDGPKKLKAPRVRSPNYPSVSLKTAIQLMGKLCNYSEMHWTPIDVAQHKLWGYTAHGSAANQCVGALKAFGLLDVTGTGEDRQVRPTDRARRIFHQVSDHESLIRQCAQSPRIYAELWREHGEHGLPPDDTLRTNLILDRKFNKGAVDDFIRQFRETIEFAKLDASDIIPVRDEDDDDSQEYSGMGQTADKLPKMLGTVPPPPSAPQLGDVPITLVLDGGAIRVVHVPRMPRAAFDLFKSLLETYKTAIVRNDGDAEQP